MRWKILFLLSLALTQSVMGVFLPPPFDKLKNPFDSLKKKPACNCECKYTKVQRCEEKVSEKCHTDYETRCETYHGKEICVQNPYEECSTEYRKQCKKKQECMPEYRKKCIKIPYDVCVDQPNCVTSYKEECKPDYEYGQKCKSIPQEHCSYAKKCETKYKQKCSRVPHEKCKYVDICVEKPHQKCKTSYNKQCKKEPVKACIPFPKKKCKKVVKKVPKKEQYQECQKCFQTKKELLEEKPRQVCKSVPKRSCKTKYRQDCKSVPQKSCHTVYKEKCQRLPKKQCKTVHRKKCSQEPYNDCKTKYQRKCQYKKQCHTSLQLSCKKPNRLRRPPVSSSYGAPLGPVKTFQISKASYGPPRVDRDVAAQQQPQQQLPQRQPQQPPQHQPQQPPQHQPQQPPQQPPLQPPKDEEEVLGEGDQGPFRPSVKFYQVPSAEDFQGEADGKKKPNSDSFRQATPFQRPPRFRPVLPQEQLLLLRQQREEQQQLHQKHQLHIQPHQEHLLQQKLSSSTTPGPGNLYFAPYNPSFTEAQFQVPNHDSRRPTYGDPSSYQPGAGENYLSRKDLESHELQDDVASSNFPVTTPVTQQPGDIPPTSAAATASSAYPTVSTPTTSGVIASISALPITEKPTTLKRLTFGVYPTTPWDHAQDSEPDHEKEPTDRFLKQNLLNAFGQGQIDHAEETPVQSGDAYDPAIDSLGFLKKSLQNAKMKKEQLKDQGSRRHLVQLSDAPEPVTEEVLETSTVVDDLTKILEAKRATLEDSLAVESSVNVSETESPTESNKNRRLGRPRRRRRFHRVRSRRNVEALEDIAERDTDRDMTRRLKTIGIRKRKPFKKQQQHLDNHAIYPNAGLANKTSKLETEGDLNARNRSESDFDQIESLLLNENTSNLTTTRRPFEFYPATPGLIGVRPRKTTLRPPAGRDVKEEEVDGPNQDWQHLDLIRSIMDQNGLKYRKRATGQNSAGNRRQLDFGDDDEDDGGDNIGDDNSSAAEPRDLNTSYDHSLHYGDITDNCDYSPKEQCQQVEECSDIPSTDCATLYRDKCVDKPENVCETVYDNHCTSEPSEECTQEYKQDCKQVPEEQCSTHYEEKCRTVYEPVTRYQIENHCYWPQSKLKDEPCH